MAHLLGHRLIEEHDVPVDLLGRLLHHARATARFDVYYGKAATPTTSAAARCTRACSTPTTARYRGPSTQQGYSPFSTWTRGLAWAMPGSPSSWSSSTRGDAELDAYGGRAEIEADARRGARATCDFYIEHGTAADGIPYWDTGAPGLHQLDGWARSAGRPVQRARAGRQFGRGDCRRRA